MTPPSKRNVRNGQGKDGGGRKRSRGSGSVSLQDNLFNPEGIFRQILQSDSWKEVKKDMDRRRVEREEEEARRNAAAREAEQQRQQQHGNEPKIMTLDAWKRQALFEKGCTRKEARGLVRVANNAREIGGTLTFSKKLLTDVAARREKKAAKDTSGRRAAREPQMAGSSTRSGKEAAHPASSHVQVTDMDMDMDMSQCDLGGGNSDAGAGSRYSDTDDEGVAHTRESILIMYTTQLTNAGLLGLHGAFLLPPRLVHEHDGDSTPTITTFAVPDLNVNFKTGVGKLDFNNWHQVGFCSLANGQYPHFCDCDSQGACALKAANMERALAFSGADKVLEGDCIHIHLLKSLVSSDQSDVFETCTLRSSPSMSDEEDSGTPCFELGTYQCREKDMVLHQVGFVDSLSGLAAGLIINDKCVSSCCTASSGFCVHRTQWCRRQQGPDWTYSTGLGDDDGAGANESGESRFEFYGSGAGHMLQEDFDKMMEKMLNDDKTGLRLRGVSKSKLPFPPTGPTSIDSILAKLKKNDKGRYELRNSPAETTPYSESSLLFHEGGVTPVQLYYGDDHADFDGGDVGILNFNNKVLFTHGLLQGCLDSQDCMSTTFRAYWRAKVMTYMRFAEGVGSTGFAGWSSKELQDVLKNRRLGDLFTDAVFDYITRLEIDYEVSFKCACPSEIYDETDERIFYIYDNACNLLRAITLRMPKLAARISCIVDTLHFSGHTRCSVFFNKKFVSALKDINSAVAEQKNRFINFMKTSVAFMCQPRAMMFLRYHLYILNQTQRTMAAVASYHGITLPKVYVSDGVGVGVKKAQSLFSRPHLEPNRKPGGAEPQRDLTHLAQGAPTQSTLMIPSEPNRDMLHTLLSSSFRGTKSNKSCLSREMFVKLDHYIETKCKPLKPYVQVKDDDLRQGMVVLLPKLELIHHELQHWSSTASEIKLISPAAMDMVHQLCTNGKISPGCNRGKLVEHAPGVAKLLEYDASEYPETAKQGLISPDLRALLTRSLELSRAALKGASECVTTPFAQPEMSKFEGMVRSATWTSDDHLAIRKVQKFRIDDDNERSRIAKSQASASGSAFSKSRAAAKERLDEAHEKAETLHACTKFKTSHRALTPGIFLSFCGRCYMCEFFELMDHSECALTPFRILSHRAWCKKDLKMYDEWLQTDKWHDPLSGDSL